MGVYRATGGAILCQLFCDLSSCSSCQQGCCMTRAMMLVSLTLALCLLIEYVCHSADELPLPLCIQMYPGVGLALPGNRNVVLNVRRHKWWTKPATDVSLRCLNSQGCNSDTTGRLSDAMRRLNTTMSLCAMSCRQVAGSDKEHVAQAQSSHSGCIRGPP